MSLDHGPPTSRRLLCRAARSLGYAALAVAVVGCFPDPDLTPSVPPQPTPPPSPVATPLPPPAAAATSQGDRYTIDDSAIVAQSTEDAARSHAASLLPCPKDRLKVERANLGQWGRVVRAYLVDGCGQRVVYVPAPRSQDESTHLVVVSRFAYGPEIPHTP